MSLSQIIAFIALMLLPSVARAEWREASTPHFLIYSQGTEKSLRQRAERLEAVHYLMLRADGLQEELHPYKVRIYVVRDTDAVQRLMSKPNPEVAGFYQPRPEGSVVFTPENTADSGSSSFAQIILFHEYAHHFMLQNFPAAYPSWFVEGRAELVSTASFEKPGVITYGKVANHRGYEIQSDTISPTKMVVAEPVEKKGFSTLSYGASWLMTHYLTFSTERSGQLAAYLQAFNGGASMTDAAKTFGDPKQFDHDVLRYLRAAKFSYRQVPIPPEIGQKVTFRILSGDEAAMLPLAMEATKTMEKAQATAFAARVTAAAAQHPDSVFAQQLLAEVQLEAGELDAAGKTADRLATLAPNVARARYIRGAVMLAKAEVMKGDPEAAVRAARREIVAANKLDPDDPLPLIAYYRSYAVAGMAAPDIAFDGLGRAFEIAPQNDSLRLNYVSALIARGYKAKAILILKPLAFSPHDDGLSAVARKMLDRLEGREAGDPNDVTTAPAEPAPAK